MEGAEFDEIAFFRALQQARKEGTVRALLIGRRALVILGLPVLTADYDRRRIAESGRSHRDQTDQASREDMEDVALLELLKARRQ